MQCDSPKALAVYCQGYGDSVMALPTLRALDDVFGGDWQLICDESVASLLFHEIKGDLIKTRFSTESGRKRFNAGQVINGLKAPDTLISMVPWYSPDIQFFLKQFHTSKSYGFYPLFDHHVPLEFSIHTARLTFEMARVFNAELRFEAFASPPQLPQEALVTVGKIFEQFPKNTKILAVHADTLDEKMWPMDRFERVLNTFLWRNPDFIAMVVGTSPHCWGNGSESYRIIPCYGLLLEVAMALVSRADLFLGVDSCMLHVADFFRVPGVGLFGATNPEEFGFLLGPHRHVCGESMQAIEADHVLDAIASLMQEVPGLQWGALPAMA